MNNLEKYKDLVKNSSASISKGMDIDVLYRHYGLTNKLGVFLERDIQDYLFNKISEKLKSDSTNDLNPNELKELKEHLLLEFFFENKISTNLIFILEVIIDAIRTLHGNIVPFDEKRKWQEAIVAALDLNLLSNSFVKSAEQLQKDYPRTFNLAKSAKYLRNKGYDVKIENARVIIDSSDFKAICNEIDNHMRLLGGIKFTHTVLNRLSSLYDSNLNRFQLNRTVGFGENPLVPIGYLLNIAAKHSDFTVINDQSMWDYYYEYVIELSVNLCAIYDVQPYNLFQLMFKGTIDTVKFIQEIALFDSIFTLKQLRPSDVTRINGLFSSIDQRDMLNKLNFNLNQFNNIIERIFNLSKKNFFPLIFEKKDLKWSGNGQILDKVMGVLSYDLNEVNENFLLPTDRPNFLFKPLIKLKDKYILLNKSWRSPAFYEALAMEVREKYELDLGTELENLIKKEMNKNNINCRSGHYKFDGEEGDCDVIVESKDTIVLIEVKKKALTRASQSGDDIKLILDLSKSLLDAQLQVGKHEILLRKNGFIKFDDKTNLEFNDRTIERIALTLLDYGGFQDRHVIDQLLSVMSTSDFVVNDPKYEEDFKELKEKTDKLKKQSKVLAKYDDIYIKFPFFNCWFFSLPQLLILIDDSSDNESFVYQMKKIKHIRFMSLDFYFEYGTLNKNLS